MEPAWLAEARKHIGQREIAGTLTWSGASHPGVL
jgi:hypothetical protein